MENEEMLEQTNESENVETQTTEENVDGIELTDTSEEVEENEETIETEEKEEVKKFTQEEVDDIVKRRLARKEREYQRELSKYQDTDNVLRTALNLSEEDDTNSKLRQFYEEDGVKLPDRINSGLSEHDVEVLARGDAELFIEEGYASMEEEANRLANIGYKNLNEREKILFTTLAEKLTEENDRKSLLSVGASEELLNTKDFQDFRKKFNSNVDIKDIYSLYKNSQPKKKKENPGSMKNAKTTGTKDYYTDEEISKMSLEDLDDPGVWETVRKSMTSRK